MGVCRGDNRPAKCKEEKESQKENRDSLRSLSDWEGYKDKLFRASLGRGSRMRRLSRACNLRAIRQRSGAGAVCCNLRVWTAEAEDLEVRPGKRLFDRSGRELGGCLNGYFRTQQCRAGDFQGSVQKGAGDHAVVEAGGGWVAGAGLVEGVARRDAV